MLLSTCNKLAAIGINWVLRKNIKQVAVEVGGSQPTWHVCPVSASFGVFYFGRWMQTDEEVIFVDNVELIHVEMASQRFAVVEFFLR